jgi:hypothetical protein
MLRRILILTAIVSALVFGFAAFALAANPPGNGQPGQTCGSQTAPTTPGGGQSTSSPGSPFQGGVSDGKYNAAESQYDVACFEVSSQP